MKENSLPRELNNTDFICLDKNGWPVEGIVHKPFKTLLRRLLFTRKIITYRKWKKEHDITIVR